MPLANCPASITPSRIVPVRAWRDGRYHDLAGRVQPALIREYDRDRRLFAFAGHDLVRGLRLRDRIALGDQWLHGDRPAADLIQERGHVAAFGPTDVGQRIIDAVHFVAGS